MADGITKGVDDIEAAFLASATADFAAEQAGQEAPVEASVEDQAAALPDAVPDQAEALLAQEGEEANQAKDPGDEPDAEDVEARAEEASQPKGAQKRIKQLVEQRNEMRQQLAETQRAFQAQMAQMQAQLAQTQEQSTQYARQQNSLLQKQLDMLSQKATNEQLEKMTPLERHEHDLRKRVASELESKIYEAVAPLKGQLDAERKARMQAEQLMERQKRYNHYNELTKRARQEVLLKDVDPTAAEPLSSEAEETLLAYAAAYGLEPSQAAPKFKNFLDRYARAKLNAQSAANKKQVTKQQSVPGVSRPTAPKAGKPRLTLAEIRKQGFTDFVEYYANQPLEG